MPASLSVFGFIFAGSIFASTFPAPIPSLSFFMLTASGFVQPLKAKSRKLSRMPFLSEDFAVGFMKRGEA